MHLLDTTSKQLKTFYGQNIPQYAILSHMWGMEEDEVLFRHIAGSDDEKREGKMRRGYAKIEGACKQAIEDGWKYIWIDTCCIDKASSAELSEAINSMYEWYRNSEVCYVYLEDVLSGGDVQKEGDEDITFPIVPFECSRWFSRGWTLQELIAPQYVVFYSKNWVDVGTKASLRDTISAMTRIRVEMLTAYDPEEASVVEKMSWAAFRETTRAEDAAYCLMGLLGVNMPLLYGEGNRAFRRLQEEIMKVSDDDSLFAWRGRLDNDKYLDNTRGMLADSPWDFRDGTNIVQNHDGAYSPYSMTNQGLQIKLPLLPVDPKRDLIGIDSENIFRVILKCTIRNTEPTRWIIIYLRKIREGYYERIFPHWLDETEAHPYETELTSLLVPQVSASTIHDHPLRSRYVEVEILPTDSGFTMNGHSLVEGYKDSYPLYNNHNVTFSKYQEKRFAVAIGSDKGIPWLDFIDIIDEKRMYADNSDSYIYGIFFLYTERGSRAHVPGRHLDRLSEKLAGEDWWVNVSVKKMAYDRYGPRFRTIINIQREPIGWYIPSAMSPIDGNFSGYLDHHKIHPKFKKEGYDWFAVFNPEVKRVLDFNLMYTLQNKSSVNCVQFSCDGKYLATGGSGTIQVYNMETGAETCTFIDKFTSDIYSICFSPDNKSLATGGDDRRVKLWDISKKGIQKVFSGHEHFIDSLCFSIDGRLVISGSRDGTVRIWEITDGTSNILTQHSHYGAYKVSVAISPHGRFVAVQDKRGIIQIWDIVTTQQLAELRGNYYMHIAFTPDGKGLVCGSADETLKYWDVSGLVPTNIKTSTGSTGSSSVFTGRDVAETKEHSIFTWHKDSVNSVAVSHDGRWVVSGSEDGKVVFWDLMNVTIQFMLEGRTSSFHSVDMSPLGNIFATASEDKKVRIWRYGDN